MAVRKKIWLIFAVFLALRLLLAFRLPIFNDESTYMRWGIGFLRNPSTWATWMLDGKQPAVAVTFGISQLLPTDPLISMRFVSILWSCITFWAVYFLLRKEHQTTVFGLLLLTFCPYLILFDTLAIAESAITAVFALCLLLTVSLIDRPAVWKGILIGVAIATGWWFKTTVLLAVPMICVTLLATVHRWQKRGLIVLSGLGIGLFSGVVLVAPVVFNPPVQYAKTAVIVRTLTLLQILHTPLIHWWAVLTSVTSWFVAFGGPLLVAAFLLSIRQAPVHRRLFIYLLWVLVPVLAEIIFLTSLSGRLLAFTIVPFIVAAVVGLSYHRTGWLQYVLVGSVAAAGIILSMSPLSFYQVLKPLPEAQGDFSQYVTGWPSGWGVAEAVGKIRELSRIEQIIVFVRLDGGNPEDAIIAYMMRAHIPVFYLEQMKDVAKIPEALARSWFFVSRGKQYSGLLPYLTKIAEYKKPLDDEFVGVYRINTK